MFGFKSIHEIENEHLMKKLRYTETTLDKETSENAKLKDEKNAALSALIPEEGYGYIRVNGKLVRVYVDHAHIGMVPFGLRGPSVFECREA